jgi:Myb/SANT-like DNA-binding domain
MEEERMRSASRNLTWTPAMTEFILKYLAEEVREGKKNQKGFKACILSDAAEAANKKFGKKMMYCHVQNHLKTVKKRWRRIEYIKSMDGVTFNPDTSTIEMQYEVYHKHVEVLHMAMTAFL